MSVQRIQLVGGPAHITYNSATAHLVGDSKIEVAPATVDLMSAIYAKVDEVVSDLVLKCNGQILTWTDLPKWFPYLTPTIGQILPTGADTPLVYLSNNGDVYSIANAVITKMPDIILGVGDPILGDIEFSAIIKDGLDPETVGSYYQIQSAQTYTPPPLDKTTIPRGKYMAAWGTIPGFTSFQAQDKWTITWDLKIEPVTVQSRTVAFRLMGLQAMAKCMPIGPTAAQIDTAIKLQGVGAVHGHKLSDQGAGDLVISGPASVTLKNVALKTAGYVFGSQPLRNGEVGFVTTSNIVNGALGPVAVLAAAE